MAGNRWKLTARERFEESYTPEPNTGCWLWLKYVNEGGYGQSYLNGRLVYAHRMAWEIYRGPIPVGMQIDHVCRVRSCVNPEHLRVVTQRTNLVENSTGLAARNIAKTHCLRGHPLSGENLLARRVGRGCRTCFNARAKDRRHERLSRERQMDNGRHSTREAK